MKYYKYGAALAILFAVLTGVSAEATTTVGASVNDGRRIQVQQKIQEMRGRASSTTDTLCSALTSRIDVRLSNFNKIYDSHKADYDIYKEKLLLIAVKLDAQGTSTVKLRADISVLDGKISVLASDHEQVRTNLEATKNYSCGTSEGQFRTSVEAVRSSQKKVADDARDIYDFIRGTLKSDVIDIRASFH